MFCRRFLVFGAWFKNSDFEEYLEEIFIIESTDVMKLDWFFQSLSPIVSCLIPLLSGLWGCVLRNLKYRHINLFMSLKNHPSWSKPSHHKGKKKNLKMIRAMLFLRWNINFPKMSGFLFWIITIVQNYSLTYGRSDHISTLHVKVPPPCLINSGPIDRRDNFLSRIRMVNKSYLIFWFLGWNLNLANLLQLRLQTTQLTV